MGLFFMIATGGFTEKVFSPEGSTILREEENTRNRRKNGLVWTFSKFVSVLYGGRYERKVGGAVYQRNFKSVC